jgi:CBS domain containing-hemolysin-like protein
MTLRQHIVSYSEDQRLTDLFFEEVNDHGFSRLPVYRGNPDNIVGILYVKDLIVEDDHITIKDTEEAFDRKFLVVRPDEFLDVVLGKMLRTKQHIAIVRDNNRALTGVISLEDILEEIIQQEIEDEDDVYGTNHNLVSSVSTTG